VRRQAEPHWAQDLGAGASVALLLIPQSLAYAQLAGMPPVRGLYAAAAPPIAAAPLTSSPSLQPGPTAMSALMTFAALSPLAPVGSHRYVELGALLALLVGAARIAIAATGLSSVAYLVSQPVVAGFVPGAAVLIVASQVPLVTGGERGGGSTLAAASRVLAHPSGWQPAALALALATVAAVACGRRYARRFPAVLAVVVAGILFRLTAHAGGPTLGPVPHSLPPLSLALPWRETSSLVLPALVIALVGFTEAVAVGRSDPTGQWHPARDFLAQGFANVAAGVSGGFPVGASFSRSALNRLAGARTSASSAVTGACVLAALPAAGLLAPLPLAVLGGIVVAATAGLVLPRRLMGIARISRPQGAIATITLFSTLAFQPHIERAVLVGVGLSLLNHLHRERTLLVEATVSEARRMVRLRLYGVLWFGSAHLLDRAVRTHVQDPAAFAVVELDLAGLGRIDLAGAEAISELVRQLRREGVEVEIVATPPHARRLVSAALSGPRAAA
jgi:SulP family sulfate permease